MAVQLVARSVAAKVEWMVAKSGDKLAEEKAKKWGFVMVEK